MKQIHGLFITHSVLVTPTRRPIGVPRAHLRPPSFAPRLEWASTINKSHTEGGTGWWGIWLKIIWITKTQHIPSLMRAILTKPVFLEKKINSFKAWNALWGSISSDNFKINRFLFTVRAHPTGPHSFQVHTKAQRHQKTPWWPAQFRGNLWMSCWFRFRKENHTICIRYRLAMLNFRKNDQKYPYVEDYPTQQMVPSMACGKWKMAKQCVWCVLMMLHGFGWFLMLKTVANSWEQKRNWKPLHTLPCTDHAPPERTPFRFTGPRVSEQKQHIGWG